MKLTRTLTLIAGGLIGAIPAISGPEPQITICHYPPGNPQNVQIITIGASAVPHHIANHPGDGEYPACALGGDVTPG